MNRFSCYAASGIAAALLAACQSIPPGAERGPHGTMAYVVLIDASAPGARIEANGQDVGHTPVHLKIFGDPDGTFHDFGSPYYVIRALPLSTNQFAQIRFFGTGQWFGPPEERVPKQIYFDMNQQSPVNPPYGPPVYGYPYYGPPVYYGPSYYWGPEWQFYGPGYYHHRHW